MGRTNYPISSAGFIVDPQSIDRLNGRQVDWAAVPDWRRTTLGTPPVVVVVGAAGAIATATSIPVAALSGAIPSGTVLNFGTNKFARLTATAAAAATALTVAAIPTALVSGDTATYPGTAGSGSKYLPAGTCVGDLLSGGKVQPRIVTTNPAIGFLETDAHELSETDARTGYGIIVGGILYEGLLPDSSGGPPKTLAAGIKTELGAGVALGTNKAFVWQVYEDTRT